MCYDGETIAGMQENIDRLTGELASSKALECRIKTALEPLMQAWKDFRDSDEGISAGTSEWKTAKDFQAIEAAMDASVPCEHAVKLEQLKTALEPMISYLRKDFGELSTRSGDSRAWVSIGDAVVTCGDVKRLIVAAEGLGK
jgi:hypothetical protein